MSVRKCTNNSTVKYLKNFGKIIRICLSSGWLTIDPFLNYKNKVKKTDRVYLIPEEIQLMTEKNLATERLTQVKDIFLFCCFTVLAYVDAKNLRKIDIGTGIDGEQWISIKRQKTNTPSRIPLLPSAYLREMPGLFKYRNTRIYAKALLDFLYHKDEVKNQIGYDV